MADAATTDPADQDPISQTFTAGNALNAKTFIDQQLQMANQSFMDSQRSVRNLDEYALDLRTYKLASMARSEAMLSQSMAMVTAVNTAAARTLLDQLPNALADVSEGQQAIKAAQTTPPDTSTLSTIVGQLAALLAGLQAVTTQGTAGTAVVTKTA